jgi:ribosomal protein S28E/S33
MSEPHINGLKKYYEIAEASDKGYVLLCKHCDTGWVLIRNEAGAVHPGNILKLLDHAYSHKTPREAKR